MVADTTVSTNEPAVSTLPSLPGVVIRLEGLAVMVGAIGLYAHEHGSGWLFALLFLVPDLSVIGYARDNRLGALTYNAAHTYIIPALLAAVAMIAEWDSGVLVALIWFAHIGMDRALGFGLKYASAFKDTHIQRL